MSFFDKWFTGLEVGLSNFLTASIGAGVTWLAVRKKLNDDSSHIGLMKILREERDDYKQQWREGIQQQLATHEEIGRLKGLCEDLQLRANELLEQEMYHQQKIGACDEKVRGLAERIKTLQVENMDLFAEVARLDPEAAKRLTDKRWNPPEAQGHPEQIV